MTDCERCDGQGEVFDRKDFWGNDLTVQCPECHGSGRRRCCPRHHYTCAASFDEYPPTPCCPSCPCQRYPADHLPLKLACDA